MDEHTAQEKRWKALLASAEWEWFRDEWGAGPNNKDAFYAWALQLGVDPGYWWETREMALHGFPQSPHATPSYAESLGHDAGGHGGGGIASAAGFAFALLPKERVLMENDEEYIKIEERRKKEWLEKNNRTDFNSPEGIDFLYGSLDDPTKPSLHTDIENEFREKFAKKAEQYDKKKKRVKRNIDNDPALQAVQERIETHAASRHELAKKLDPNVSQDDIYKRVERIELERFVTKHPEKVRAYVLGKEGKKYPELARAYDTVQTKEITKKEIRHTEKVHPQAPTISQEEAERRLREALGQATHAPSGLYGPTGTPLPSSLGQEPPPPPPTPPQQPQQQAGGGQSASRAAQSVRNWRAAKTAKKAEGEAAQAVAKASKLLKYVRIAYILIWVFGILGLAALLFYLGAPFIGPGGTGGGTTPGGISQTGVLDYTIPFRDTSVVVSNPTAKDDVRKEFPSAQIQYWDVIISESIANGWNPAFVLTLWIEETGASHYTKTGVGGGGVPAGYNNDSLPYFANGHIGCAPLQDQTIQESLRCLFKNFEIYRTTADFEPFMRRYSGENPTGFFVRNPHFPPRVKKYYSLLVPNGVTLIAITPPNTTPGAITSDGTHACPVVAEYTVFPGSYAAIDEGKYSFVCGHCRPIYNANDVGAYPQGGTPVVAVTNGVVENITNPVGGTALWLTGDDGRNYYFAHLKREGLVTGRIKAGDIIGYIASASDTSSRNNGIAHVHFSAGTPGNQQSFNDPANIPAGPLLDNWCNINVCNGKPNVAYACGG